MEDWKINSHDLFLLNRRDQKTEIFSFLLQVLNVLYAKHLKLGVLFIKTRPYAHLLVVVICLTHKNRACGSRSIFKFEKFSKDIARQ